MADENARFARAFLAMSYVLGERQAAVAGTLLGPDAERLAVALASPLRPERARALALELSRIALGVEQGGLR
jgi:hypothetical protein